MFRKRLLSLAIAAATLGIAILGETNRAEAALRLVVMSGAETDYFYSSSSNILSTGGFVIDGYKIQIDTTSSNHPGTATIGSISTTANFTGTTTATPNNISFTADVIAAQALADGQQTSVGNIATLTGASLLAFTAPSGTPVNVTADVSASLSPIVTGGSLTDQTFYKSPPGTSFVAGDNVVSNTQPLLTAGGGGVSTVSRSNSGTYNLGQIVTLSAVALSSADSGNFSITGTSTVLGPSAVPEPTSIVLAFTSLPALGLLWMRRRARA